MTARSALVPGAGTALVGATSFALFASAPRSLVARLWPVVDAGGDIDALLDVASAEGLRTLGAFALARVEADGIRVLVRGDAAAVITAATGLHTFDARGVRTWAEHFVDGGTSFELRLGHGGTAADEYHVDSGVVPATSIRWPHDPGAADDDVGPTSDEHRDEGSVDEGPDEQEPEQVRDDALGAPADDDGCPAELAEQKTDTAVGAAPRPVLAEPTVHLSEFGEAEDPDHDGHTRPHHETDGEPEGAHVDGDRPDADVVQADDGEADPGAVTDDGYDALYGRTIHRSVQQAAVDPDPDPVEEPVDSTDDEGATAGPVEMPAPPAPPGTPSSLISGVPISSVPGSVPPPPEQPGVPPQPGGRLPDGDHDGHTISAAQLRAMRAADGQREAAPAVTMGGPTVQAVTCPSGHPNPPHLATCRACSMRLDGPPQVIARPSLGRIVLSTGDVIELTRPAVVGRNPKVEGRLPSEVPQTVRLDVGQALSRSHVMIRLEGWQVLVEDLGSANGTLVTLPGRVPQRLHAGEPILLEPGAEIDLGGEVTGTYRLGTRP